LRLKGPPDPIVDMSGNLIHTLLRKRFDSGSSNLLSCCRSHAFLSLQYMSFPAFLETMPELGLYWRSHAKRRKISGFQWNDTNAPD
jgi:hypothetical protein